MVNKNCAQKFCKEDITLIENYDKAMADMTNTWHCHHRDEIRTLPSGITVFRSRQELIDNDRYFNCPANELIFLTPSEHKKLHKSGAAHHMYGKTFTDESLHKISESLKGEKNPMYGKTRTFSDETRRRMSESKKAYYAAKRKEGGK